VGEAEKAPKPKWPERKPLRQLNPRHYPVAQMLVQGRKVSEVSRQTGYSPTYVSRIQKDPVMQELLAYYARRREEAFAYTLRREMEIVTGLDELRERLARRKDRRGTPMGAS
jgi:hypothetical protein